MQRLVLAVFACLAGIIQAALAATDGPFETLPRSFTGVLPAASGPGIAWQLDLLEDGSFQLRRTYLEREPDNVFDSIGRWVVGSDGQSLLLAGDPDEPITLSIESTERLRLLDRDTRPIVSELPYHLDLADVPLLEPELELTGMYRYMADAAVFDECLTGRRLPVAFVAENIALERAYLELQQASGREPGEPVLAELSGRIARLAPMEGDGLVPTLEPLRFIALHPDASCAPPFRQVELAGPEWQLIGLGDTTIEVDEDQRRPTLVFSTDELRVAGFGGCNRLLGGFATHGDQLRFSRTASTMMACPVGMDLEQALLQALGSTDRYRVLGHHLDLYASDGTPLARFAAAPTAD
jgi:copper homeostasis protein (lipoprotein)